MKNILVAIITILSLTSSAQPCSDSWCHEKKRYRFWMLKKCKIEVDTSLVKVTGVYIREFESRDRGQEVKKHYKFYRFFDNGRVYMSCAYCSFPDSIELNALNHGHYRYYTIEGGMVKIENFGSKGGYFYDHFTIEKDRVVPSYTSTRTRFFKPVIQQLIPHTDAVLIFHDCELDSKSFW
jgi:hypothetical protein